MADPVKGITGRIGRRCGALAHVSLQRQETTAWQSLLFDGGRHRIAFDLDGARIDEALALVQDEIDIPDFAIPGHLVADIKISAIDRGVDHATVTLDAMTIRN